MSQDIGHAVKTSKEEKDSQQKVITIYRAMGAALIPERL